MHAIDVPVSRTRLARGAALIAGLCTLCAVWPAVASARAHSFEGSCDLQGVVKLDNPMGFVPSPNGFVDSESGTCTGKLDGRALPARGVRVSALATGDFVGGCGSSVATGALWRLTFHPGATRKPIRRAHGKTVRLRDVLALTTGVNETVLVRGERGGMAAVTSTFQSGSEALDQCREGRFTSVAVTRELRTLTPVAG
jgi:hypothetical protein